jgi:hypothetical protein
VREPDFSSEAVGCLASAAGLEIAVEQRRRIALLLRSLLKDVRSQRSEETWPRDPDLTLDPRWPHR